MFVLINFSSYDLHDLEVDLGDDQGEYREIFRGEEKNLESRYLYVDMKRWTYQVWIKIKKVGAFPTFFLSSVLLFIDFNGILVHAIVSWIETFQQQFFG